MAGSEILAGRIREMFARVPGVNKRKCPVA